MAAYSYRALNHKSDLVKGIIEGDSKRQVRAALRAQSLKPLQVDVSIRSGTRKDTRRPWTMWFSPRISRAELALVTRQLATLVHSGLPLAEALQAAARQARKPRLMGVLLQLRGRVVEGHTLAYALGEFPRSFNGMYTATVRAGERAGYLAPVLLRLAEYSESSQYTQQKLRMAMIYPLVLVAVAAAVIIALMAFVMPKLVGIFQRSDRVLPDLTRALIAISDFLVNYGFYTLLGLLGVAAIVKLALRQPRYKLQWHRLLLRLPLLARWQVALDSTRLSATLSILVASGVPLLEALQIASQVPTNLALREACEKLGEAVSQGSSLHVAMERADIFPPMLVQMVASGESGGKLDEMLERATDNQERELELSLNTTMSLLEPCMVILMGAAVLLIVLAVLLPIFDLNSLVR
jgi:general secretion pathway protein F